MFGFYTQKTINKRKTKLDSKLFLFASRWDIFFLSNKGEKNTIMLSTKFFKEVKKGQIRNYEKWQIRQLVKKRGNISFSL